VAESDRSRGQRRTFAAAGFAWRDRPRHRRRAARMAWRAFRV